MEHRIYEKGTTHSTGNFLTEIYNNHQRLYKDNDGKISCAFCFNGDNTSILLGTLNTSYKQHNNVVKIVKGNLSFDEIIYEYNKVCLPCEKVPLHTNVTVTKDCPKKIKQILIEEYNNNKNNYELILYDGFTKLWAIPCNIPEPKQIISGREVTLEEYLGLE